MGFPARVLVADDEPDLRDLLVSAMRTFGHDVVSAATGREALDLLLRDDFELAVLDHQMPELTGTEVVRELTAACRTPRPALLVISALGYDAHVRGDAGQGADGYLAKPFSLAELRLRVQVLLDERLVRD